MNINDYKIIERIHISNKKELRDFTEKYFDKHILSYRENGSLKRRLLNGIDIRIGKYSRIVEEFTDPFDFPYSFYKKEIFVPQNDGEFCL